MARGRVPGLAGARVRIGRGVEASRQSGRGEDR